LKRSRVTSLLYKPLHQSTLLTTELFYLAFANSVDVWTVLLHVCVK